MNDYCKCGKISIGKCVKDHTIVCSSHVRNHPSVLVQLLRQDILKSNIPSWAAGNNVLCQKCYDDSMTAVLPYVLKHLDKNPERAVLQVIEKWIWDGDSSNDRIPLGPRIIEALAGRKPDWLFDSSTQTLAALYARIAGTPPQLRVKYEYETKTKGLFGGKVNLNYDLVGQFSAWALFYSDGEQGMVLLVGARGGTISVERSWWPNKQNVIMLKHFRPQSSTIARIKREVEAVPQNSGSYYVDLGIRDALIQAIKERRHW